MTLDPYVDEVDLDPLNRELTRKMLSMASAPSGMLALPEQYAPCATVARDDEEHTLPPAA